MADGSDGFRARLAAAVGTLHAPTSTAQQQQDANAWLVALAADDSTPALCEAVLASPGALPEAALVVAAGVLSTSAVRAGGAAVPALLQLCSSLESRPVVARLAAAAAEASVSVRAEDRLLGAAGFVSLDAQRQLLVLEALADSLAAQASPEELAARPTAVAACRVAVEMLALALAAPHGSTADSAMRVLGSWAGCGVSYTALCSSHPHACSRLLSHLATAPTDVAETRTAALAAAALRDLVSAGSDLGDEIEPRLRAPLDGALGAFAPFINQLGASDGRAAEPLTDAAHLAAAVTSLAAAVVGVSADALGEAAGGQAGTLPRGALSLLLASTDHPSLHVAEAAAAGWLDLCVALPRGAPSTWQADLFERVAGALLSRCALAPRGRGDCTSGEIARDEEEIGEIEAYRGAHAAPLLCALCDQLGGVWLRMLSTALRDAVAARRGASAHPCAIAPHEQRPTQHNDGAQLEALCFAIVCTSEAIARAPGTCWHARTLVEGAALANELAALSRHVAPGLPEACRQAAAALLAAGADYL